MAASIEHTFAYFSDPRNLRQITPGWLSLIVRDMDADAVGGGCHIDYTIRWMRVPIAWTTHIVAFDPPHRFVDTQLRGPYRYWWHEHRFEALSDGTTRMSDRVEYALPLGPLGSIAHAVAVRRQLDAILRYRAGAVKRVFPGSGDLLLSRGRA